MSPNAEDRASTRGSTRASKRVSKGSRVPSSRLSVASKRASISSKRQSTSKSPRQSTRLTGKDEPFGLTNTADVPGIVADLRKTFDSDHTKSKSWRLAQLKALKKMLLEETKVFTDAAMKDVKKSRYEVTMIDVQAAASEATFAIRHLEQWMADGWRPTNAANLPAKSVIKQEPLGVVLVIGAWNYNINLSLCPLVGAIAAGNCAILKPGDFTPHLSEAIARMVTKYLDPAAVRCVTGGPDVATAVLAERFDMIFFTGSTRIGKIVAAAAAKNLTPTVLELGGKSPCIVDKHANIEVAARRILWAGNINAGQTCVRPDYVMVHNDIADELIKEMKKVLIEFFGKDPKKSEWFSRVVHDNSFDRITGQMEKDSKYIIHGGQSDASERYIAPTLLDFGTDMESFNKSALMQDEIFGPVTPIVRYTGLANQVVPFIRRRPKPLALYVFSEKSKVSEYVLNSISSGSAAVNECLMQITNDQLPFGGVGESGHGNYHGTASFEAFSHAKSVLINNTKPDAPARFPPHSKETQEMIYKILGYINAYPQLDEVLVWCQYPKNQIISVMALVILILLVAK